jgi:hypothetical protein
MIYRERARVNQAQAQTWCHPRLIRADGAQSIDCAERVLGTNDNHSQRWYRREAVATATVDASVASDDITRRSVRFVQDD